VSSLETTSVTGDTKPKVLFDSVYGACFSPDGNRLAILSSNGIEIATIPELKRTVVIPIASFGERRYRLGGLSWSRTTDTIALSLYDPRQNMDEILTVPATGGTLKVICTTNEATIRNVSFIKTH
jgi:hypothetical protein